MNTLPLFEEASCKDAAHGVVAPGGYEWWYFDAEDPATDTQVVAIFFEGFVFHAGYLREYAAYRRWPTRNKPPLPRDYPCAYFVVYRGGRILAQFMTQYPAAAFAASTARPEVAIGPNRMTRREDGAYVLSVEGHPWRLTGRGPVRPEGGRLSGTFTFTPRFEQEAHERAFLSRAMTGADHRWVLAAPACEVAGTVRFTPHSGAAEEVIEFAGRGYHDHNYGTAPLGPGLRRWTWGRAIFDDGVRTFHVAEPADPRRADEVHLIEATAGGIEELPVSSVRMSPWRHTSWGLQYPQSVHLADEAAGDRLRLTNPRVVDSSPFYLRVSYQATDGRHRMGRAFCEIAYPHRLRWPVLGRMIEMSIHRLDRE